MAMPRAAKVNMTAASHRSLELAAPEVFVDLFTGCAALLLEATAEAGRRAQLFQGTYHPSG